MALLQIQSGTYQRRITELRGYGESIYKQEKKKLPTFHFNGTFDGTVTNQKLVRSSGIYHFDIDKLDPNKIEQEKAKIAPIPSCVFCFVSPSNKGLKGGLRVDPEQIKNDADFKAAFSHVKAEIKSTGLVLDEACKDVRRACFVSYDPSIYINYDAVLFRCEPTTKPETNTVEATYIDRALNVLRSATPGTRHAARLKAGKLAGGFIAGGLVNEAKITDLLLQLSDSVANQGSTPASERKTLLDAIENGKHDPISYTPYTTPTLDTPAATWLIFTANQILTSLAFIQTRPLMKKYRP